MNLFASSLKRVIQALLCWLLPAVLSSALVAEFYCRYILKLPVSGIAFSRRLGWTFQPSGIFGRSESNAHFNSLGFRDQEHEYRKPAGAKRLLFLGDSYVAGTAVPFEDTFPRQVAAQLAPDMAIETLIEAVSAWGTDQQYSALMTHGLHFSPDCVVLAISPSDLRETVAKGRVYSDGENLTFRPFDELRLTDRLAWFLANRSAAFAGWQRYAGTNVGSFQWIFARFPMTWPGAPEKGMSDLDTFAAAPLPMVIQAEEVVGGLVLKMSRAAREHGAKFLFTVLPTKVELGPVLVPGLHESGRLGRVFEMFGAKHSIDYADIWAELRRSPNPLLFYIEEEYHFNRKGHAWVAASLLPKVRTCLAG